MTSPVKDKIYVYWVPNTSNNAIPYHFKARAQDGTVFAQYDCVSEDQAKTEMTAPYIVGRYRDHYPSGYELTWAGPVDMAAPRPVDQKMKGSADFIHAALDLELRRALAASPARQQHPNNSDYPDDSQV